MQNISELQVSKLTELLNELKEKGNHLSNIIEDTLEGYGTPISVDYEYGQLNLCNDIINKLTDIINIIPQPTSYSISDIYSMHQGGVKFNKDLNLICI